MSSGSEGLCSLISFDSEWNKSLLLARQKNLERSHSLDLIDVTNDANNEKMYQHCLARGKTSSQSSSMKRLQWNSRFKLNKSFTYVYNYLH